MTDYTDRITNLQKPPSTWSNEKILAYYKDAKYILQKLKGHNEYLDIRFIDELNKYDSYIDIN